MKTLLLTAALCLSLFSCRKQPPPSAAIDPAEQPAATEVAPAAPGQDAPAAAVDYSDWGFAAQLPKETEGVSSFYRAGDIVRRVYDSRWFFKLRMNQVFAGDLQSAITDLRENPGSRRILEMIEAIAGSEVVVAMAPGAHARIRSIEDSYERLLLETFIFLGKALIVKRPEGGLDAAAVEPLQKEVWARVIKQAAVVVAELEMPPVLIAARAAGERDQINTWFDEFTRSMAGSHCTAGSFSAEGGAVFHSLRWTLATEEALNKLASANLKDIPPILGGAEETRALLRKFIGKSVEISWGWVGDYFVVSLGSDHRHVKFARAGEGLMTLPEISRHLKSWKEKKPVAFAYRSQSAVRIQAGGSIIDSITAALEAANTDSILPLKHFTEDVKKLGARESELWPNDADAFVAAAWLAEGLQSEWIGGPKPHDLDCARPLSLTALGGPATVYSSVWRRKTDAMEKAFDFADEAAAVLLESYHKHLKPAVPPADAAQLAKVEALGGLLLKGLWKSAGEFRSGLGSESALLVSLDGVPPADFSLRKPTRDWTFPRALYASEMKDRDRIITFGRVIRDLLASLSALDPSAPISLPKEESQGALTSWGWNLDGTATDNWLHTAMDDKRCYVSTSRSLTKSLSSAAAVPSGRPAGAFTRVNFTALWDFAARNFKPDPQHDPKKLENSLTPLRALEDLTIIRSETGGQSYGTMHLRIKETE